MYVLRASCLVTWSLLCSVLPHDLEAWEIENRTLLGFDPRIVSLPYPRNGLNAFYEFFRGPQFPYLFGYLIDNLSELRSLGRRHP